jgi:AcrR family transcriptional regulator
MESMMKPATQRDLQAEVRRNQLLDIALALFAERGIENVTIKDLAAEASVAQGLIYHYFESKEDLLLAVMQRESPVLEFKTIIEQIYDYPVQEGLTVFAGEIAALLTKKRRVMRLLIREVLSPRATIMPEVIAIRSQVLSMLAAYFERRIAAGEIKGQPAIVVHMLVSSFLTLILLDQPLEPMVPHFVEILLEGIKAE